MNTPTNETTERLATVRALHQFCAASAELLACAQVPENIKAGLAGIVEDALDAMRPSDKYLALSVEFRSRADAFARAAGLTPE